MNSLKLSKKDLKMMGENMDALDITYFKNEEIQKIKKDEEYFKEVAYSSGTYGVTGLLLQGNASKKYYIIASRTSAIYSI